MKALILALAVGFSGSVFAELQPTPSVDGHWVGEGYWMYGEDGVGCPSMNIQFAQTPIELIRGKGKFICDMVTLHTDPLTWQVQPDGKLLLNGVESGALTPTGFTTVEPYNDEGTMVHTTFSVDGNLGTYEERWIGKDGTEIYLIHADFKRK